MLKAYDKTLTEISGTDGITFIEASWNRKMNEFGDFMVYTTLEIYKSDLVKAKYIRNPNRPEWGVIQKVEYSKKDEGEFVTISGFFAEKLLNYCSRAFATTIDGTTGDGLIDIYKTEYLPYACAVRENHYPVGSQGVTLTIDSSISDSDQIDKDWVYTTSADEQAGDVLFTVLEDRGMYFNATPKYSDDGEYGLTVKVKKGTNRSKSIVFSEGNGNVSELSYSVDESATYEMFLVYTSLGYSAYIATRDSYDTKWVEEVDGNKAYKVGMYYQYSSNNPERMGDSCPLKAVELNTSTDIDFEDTSASTVNAIKTAMRTTAILEKSSACIVSDINATVIQIDGYEYLTDYDLGDIVTLNIADMDVSTSARIVEIAEQHIENRIDVTVTLGDVTTPSGTAKSKTTKKKSSSKRSNSTTSSKVSALSSQVETSTKGTQDITITLSDVAILKGVTGTITFEEGLNDDVASTTVQAPVVEGYVAHGVTNVVRYTYSALWGDIHAHYGNGYVNIGATRYYTTTPLAKDVSYDITAYILYTKKSVTTTVSGIGGSGGSSSDVVKGNTLYAGDSTTHFQATASYMEVVNGSTNFGTINANGFSTSEDIEADGNVNAKRIYATGVGSFGNLSINGDTLKITSGGNIVTDGKITATGAITSNDKGTFGSLKLGGGTTTVSSNGSLCIGQTSDNWYMLFEPTYRNFARTYTTSAGKVYRTNLGGAYTSSSGSEIVDATAISTSVDGDYTSSISTLGVAKFASVASGGAITGGSLTTTGSIRTGNNYLNSDGKVIGSEVSDSLGSATTYSETHFAKICTVTLTKGNWILIGTVTTNGAMTSATNIGVNISTTSADTTYDQTNYAPANARNVQNVTKFMTISEDNTPVYMNVRCADGITLGTGCNLVARRII